MYHDAEQQKIIELSGSTALVLAGPGCGKTHILARRVFHAATHGEEEYCRMLCVTFTNRAAREMKEKIEGYTGCVPNDLFVGNMHRFCLSFLYKNNILDADTSVLDEEDQLDFLATILERPTPDRVKDFLTKAAYLYQQEHDHPDWIVRRPDRPFAECDFEAVEAYKRFKNENRLIDFDDILLNTYSALQQQQADYVMTDYHWVQVDEVQDMTPLQLAIIDAVTMRHNRTLIYFGDEQQAIFRFIGAGGRALEVLKRQCRGNILRLKRNYRSAGHLVDMCNTLATDWLGLERDFLPEAVNENSDTGTMILYSTPVDKLQYVAANICRNWLSENPKENVALLVRTNKEADELSDLFRLLGLCHFKVSKQDLFHQVPFKTVWSHLAAVSMPFLRHPWARLLYQLRCITTLTGARNFVRMLRDSAIGCDELFAFGRPLRIENLIEIYDSDRDIIVFDTETTGLDTLSDDVVQIAAIKLHHGEVSDHFDVFIHTDKRLPRELSPGVANPIVEDYVAADKTKPEDAFKAFIAFVADAVIAGHNIGFDIKMIRSNIQRRTALDIPDFLADDAGQIDTLTLARLLYPRHKSYRLKDLIVSLGLEGVNSHNASDDVMATYSLISALVAKARKIMPRTKMTHSNPKVMRVAEKLTKVYSEFYFKYRSLLSDNTPGRLNTLSDAIRDTDSFLKSRGFTAGIPRLDYAIELFESCLSDPINDRTFSSRLTHHLFDLLSFNESDLFANGIVNERLSIMTVHKAKGLEMDNVVVFNAGRESGDITDFARLLYVAFSRARKRLAVGVAGYMPAPLVRLKPVFQNLASGRINAAVESELANLRCSKTINV